MVSRGGGATAGRRAAQALLFLNSSLVETTVGLPLGAPVGALVAIAPCDLFFFGFFCSRLPRRFSFDMPSSSGVFGPLGPSSSRTAPRLGEARGRDEAPRASSRVTVTASFVRAASTSVVG